MGRVFQAEGTACAKAHDCWGWRRLLGPEPTAGVQGEMDRFWGGARVEWQGGFAANLDAESPAFGAGLIACEA